MRGQPSKSVTNGGGAGTNCRANKRSAAPSASKKKVQDNDDSEESTSSDEEVEVVSDAVSQNTRKSASKKSKVNDAEEDDEESKPSKKITARSGTSDKKASDKRTKKDDERVAPARPELGDHLDCTVCLNKPASPIHSCANGHIICGICVDKVKTCGLCQTALQVSAFAERLSRQFELKLPCPNKNTGCSEVIAAVEMKNHLQNCSYRDIVCTVQRNGGCDKTKVTLREYAQHLKERHRCNVRSSACYGLTLRDNKISKEGSGHSRHWTVEMLEKDGNTFLLHSRIGLGSLYFWMTVLGGKEAAEKYMFEFKLFKSIEGGKQIEASWKMPVLAFHDRPTFVKHLPYYVVIPVKMLSRFCTTKANKPPNITELCFDVSYKIL